MNKQITITCREGTNNWQVDFDCSIRRRDITRIQRSLLVEFTRAQRRHRLDRIKESKDDKQDAHPDNVVSQHELENETPPTPTNNEPLEKDEKSHGSIYHPAR